MPDYFVFGGCLRSELVFPELVESHDREPDWTLRLATLPHEDGAEILADSRFTSSCRIVVSRHQGKLRYSHSCAGTFELDAGRREIVFDAAHCADMNAARTDLVARLLLICVDRERVTWLHGSAVRLNDAAIAFIGPSGAGKSTLALALARAGAEHICDDALPVEAGDPPMVWASDHVIRLHHDSKRELACGADSVRRESDGKFVLTHDAIGTTRIRVPENGSLPSRAPLAALYLLVPVAPSASVSPVAAVVSRRLISPRAALPSLIQHLKLGAWLPAEEPVRTMRQLAAVVASVPVFELRITRDWSAIDEAAAQLFDWHTAAGDRSVGHARTLRVEA